MVLSKHCLDGLDPFEQDTMSAWEFEALLNSHNYYIVDIQAADYKGRFCYIFQHKNYRDVYAIYIKDHSRVITAYHP